MNILKGRGIGSAQHSGDRANVLRALRNLDLLIAAFELTPSASEAVVSMGNVITCADEIVYHQPLFNDIPIEEIPV